MRILVTGAGGLVGGRLATLLGRRHAVTSARHHTRGPAGLPEVPFDLGSRTSIEAAVEQARPDAVVHSAALANADLCESQPAIAERLNVRGSESLAAVCHARGVRLVALSTDLVLGGDLPWADEAQPARPLMTYGRTKLEAEAAVLGRAPGSAVARLAIVLGRGYGPRPSASEAIAWAIGRRVRLKLFTDQFRTPVDLESVGAAIESLLETPGEGVYNLGGPERLSRHELGLRVASVLGLPADLIEPGLQSKGASGAARPADVSLDSSRAVRELGFAPRGLDEAVADGRPRRPEPEAALPGS